MQAYYYRIYDVKIPSLTIDEGIIRNCEDTIYPAQNNYIDPDKYPDLPFECEAHHFRCHGANIEGFYFDIPVDVVKNFKIY